MSTGRRINETDLLEVLGKVSSRENVQAFVCGPPPMTDAMVDVLTGHKCGLWFTVNVGGRSHCTLYIIIIQTSCRNVHTYIQVVKKINNRGRREEWTDVIQITFLVTSAGSH